ncbi:hypothetical protein ON010_g2374 [Phytophthora cinnamomi]|nr:hypothetical protein ON010_g2374 [Phytophthora cinnamomi]
MPSASQSANRRSHFSTVMSVSNWSSSSSSSSEDEDDAPVWPPARLAEEGVAYRVVCVPSASFYLLTHSSLTVSSRPNTRRNVLGSGFVNDRVDIEQLALLVRNADYAPRVRGAFVSENAHIAAKWGLNVLVAELQRAGDALPGATRDCAGLQERQGAAQLASVQCPAVTGGLWLQLCWFGFA